MIKKYGVGAALCAAIVAVVLFAALRPRSAQPLEIGDSAPGFALPLLSPNGAPGSTIPVSTDASAPTIRLSDYRHRVVLVNFWATWCAPCVEEAPSLEKFSEQMRSQGVVVIGVSVDQNTADLERFVAEYHLSFPIARDPNQALSGRYGTFKFPETYILDRDHNVADKIISSIDWQDPRIIDFVRDLVQPSQRAAR